MAVGGWGARHPEQHAGGAYNTFAGPIALEKQVEYGLPLVKATVAGPAFCATWLETRACAQPVLEFASLLLKPQILISLVPEHGSIHVDHSAFPETGRRPGDPAPYTVLRDYGYKLGIAQAQKLRRCCSSSRSAARARTAASRCAPGERAAPRGAKKDAEPRCMAARAL
jgi:hypothetical protein